MAKKAKAVPAPGTCDCGSGRTPDASGVCFDCRVVPWKEEQIMRSQEFGPAIIGKAQYQYVQSFVRQTSGGVFGPALLGVIPDAYKDQRKKAEKPAVDPDLKPAA